MTTLGIDLSSQPQGTAAAVIHWTSTEATSELYSGCDDGQLHELIRNAAVIGIDAPFGWPHDFQSAPPPSP